MCRLNSLQCTEEIWGKKGRLDCIIGSWWRGEAYRVAAHNPLLTDIHIQIGHIACQIASRVMGMRVIGIDSQRKKDLVLECGAELFVDHQHGCVAGEVKAATAGLGAQAVLVLTGAVRAYAGGMSLLRSGGTLVCVGIPIGAMKPIETAYVQEMVRHNIPSLLCRISRV